MIFKQLFIVFCLGFSSGLPMALVSSTLQAWFADAGLSVWITSSLSLMSLPYLYRFLWSPVLDRYPILRIGKRRGWILCMQVLLALGFYLMTYLAPETSPMVMAGLAFIIATLSATQDAGIDAHRTEYLPSYLYGIGASIASLGYRLAILFSGGLALIIAQNYGWPVTYRVMSVAMMIGILAIFWSPEPSTNDSETPLFATFMDPVRDLLARPEILPLCIFILLFKFGEAFTTSTSGIIMPFLIQGMGFSLSTIGYVTKIWGVVAIIVGGLVGGLVLVRWQLYRALFLFGVLQALSNVVFIILAALPRHTELLALAVISDNFAAGMGSTAVVALLMVFVNHKYTATQFSVLVGISGLPRVFSGPIGALLHEYYGWTGLYCISSVLALAFIPFLYRLRRQPCFQVEKHAYD
ncbi:MAG: MFS transporter [Gammaproteobacteria bacterium]|nr:MFS transporter [Gammaproteobacteria bacterium]